MALSTDKLKRVTIFAGNVMDINRIDGRRVDDLVEFVLADVEPLWTAIYAVEGEISGATYRWVLSDCRWINVVLITIAESIEVSFDRRIAFALTPHHLDVGCAWNQGAHVGVPGVKVLKGRYRSDEDEAIGE
jgi:hypothetical protein